jgi:hypothetical protein
MIIQRTVAILTVTTLLGLAMGCTSKVEVPVLEPAASTFGGKAGEPRETIVVPTLDSPLVKGKSAIWCSSFQAAWKALATLSGEPLEIENAKAVADRLNGAPESAADLPEGSWYAAAGLLKDNTIQRIQKEMRARFPWHSVPDVELEPDDAAFAYAFIAAEVKFETVYFDAGTLAFKSGSGTVTPVDAFGVRKSRHNALEDDRSRKLREQVEVLSYEEGLDGPEFVIDLCRSSSPSQILVAKLKLEDSLASTVEHVEEISKPQGPIQEEEELLVPRMSFLLEHRFGELEGKDKVIGSGSLAGNFIRMAWQSIRFELNEGGAKLVSEAKMVATKAADRARRRRFVLDGPFLVILKKRGAKHPFFVLWIEGAEMLSKA